MIHANLSARCLRRTAGSILLAALLTAGLWASFRPALAEESSAAIETRIRDTVVYLASDKLEGRGVETKGINLAADFLGKQFAEIGLKTNLYDGTPFERFEITISSKLGPAEHNVLEIDPAPEDHRSVPPGKLEPGDSADASLSRLGFYRKLELGRDFNPLTAGGSGEFKLPLVFVGYGITAPEAKYDDYAGIDVKGKAVIILRHQPQRANPHSPLGADPSWRATFDSKISNAYEHGAAAILFTTDEYEIHYQQDQVERRWQAAVDALLEAREAVKKIVKPTEADVARYRDEVNQQAALVQKFGEQLSSKGEHLLDPHGAGEGGKWRDIPVFYCSRDLVNCCLKESAHKELATVEQQIDESLKPQSFDLPGERAIGRTEIESRKTPVRNVIGVLEGEGPHADETIVIGAHYDHLGYGGFGSAAPGVHAIHHGADDNASGTVALLEIARRLASLGHKLPRRIVIISFTGEERGLLGSAYYIKHPLVPLDKTIAMLNLDMVGRLRNDKLIINGMGTAKEFDALVRRIDVQHDFQLIKKPEGFGPSDHASFYAMKVPVLHFFTGAHSDYHRPSDTADKLNIPGIRRVSSLVAEIAVALAEAPGRPTYQVTKAPAMGSGGTRPYFGSIPDYSQEEPGVRLQGVSPDGPAARAGLKAGDVIIRFGESRIGTIIDFDSALRKHKAGDKVAVVLRRGKEEKTIEVTLDPPR